MISRENNGERKDGRSRFINLWVVQMDGAKAHKRENWEKSGKYRAGHTVIKKVQFLPLYLTSSQESQCR